MSLTKKLWMGFKAARYLGIRTISLYGLYQIELRSGWQKIKTKRDLRDVHNIPFSSFTEIAEKKNRNLFELPDKNNLLKIPGINLQAILTEADQICNGVYKQFGNDLTRINLEPELDSDNWTDTRDDDELKDLKFIWEPARFGWVFTLGRAFLLSGNEKYPEAFWGYFETFRKYNPPYLGPNWASSQEAGLRIMAFAFAWQVFSLASVSTENRLAELLLSVCEHAARIPPGLIYARAQRNNHLLTEAAGLYTAGILLEGFQQAKRWKNLGWKWFHQGLSSQISDGGTYSQHSMNYHRLMLQCALWVNCLAENKMQAFPASSLKKLSAAAHWLICQVDPKSGKTPNLGSNDGALILPLSSCKFSDFRPTAQSAAAAFLDQKIFPAGEWDELFFWLGSKKESQIKKMEYQTGIEVLKIGDRHSWATIRVPEFKERPSHADLLHLDLWYEGKNFALDAGTYRYTAPPPWNNSLSKTCVHNTASINGQDQMKKAGRFLWLDWAESKVLVKETNRIVAEHYGYKKSGVIHRREVIRKNASSWIITDYLLPADNKNHKIQVLINWLLPDLPFTLDGQTLQLLSEPHRIQLTTDSLTSSGFQPVNSCRVSLVRAGKNLLSNDEKEWPIHGWFSPTYANKEPTLSYLLQIEGTPPLAIQSKWSFFSEITG